MDFKSEDFLQAERLRDMAKCALHEFDSKLVLWLICGEWTDYEMQTRATKIDKLLVTLKKATDDVANTCQDGRERDYFKIRSEDLRRRISDFEHAMHLTNVTSSDDAEVHRLDALKQISSDVQFVMYALREFAQVEWTGGDGWKLRLN
jgi:hypothetical protein